MRYILGWGLMLLTLSARGQVMSDDALATLPLEGEEPSARPTLPERPVVTPATQPTEVPEAPMSEQYLLGDVAGFRKKLADHGITLAPLLTVDAQKNVRGGADTAGCGITFLFDLPMTFDLEKLMKIKGGSVYLNFQVQHGRSADDEAGDFQSVSTLTADGRTQLSELWYQQSLFEGKLVLKAGKIDANSDFALSEYSAGFLNAAVGLPRACTILPTYPDPAMGLEIMFNPSEHCYLQFGVFDGALQEGIATGSRGPATLFGSPADLFYIGETGATWQVGGAKLPGRLRLGAWYHSGTFDKFGGGAQDGAWGGFVVLDQRVWRENPGKDGDDQGIAMFVEYDWADADVLPIAHHISGGAVWTGAIPTRDNDAIGLATTCAIFTNKPAAGFTDDYELTIEAYYKLAITPYFSLRPDVQYIVNPGGQGLGDACVVGVRMELAI